MGSSGEAANVSKVLRGLPWVQVDGAWKELLSKGRGAEGCWRVPEDGENGEGSSFLRPQVPTRGAKVDSSAGLQGLLEGNASQRPEHQPGGGGVPQPGGAPEGGAHLVRVQLRVLLAAQAAEEGLGLPA